jgi:hypothetical protein
MFITLCYQVNVVKGLKIYEDVFTTSELMKVADFINGIRQAGRNGELSGKLLWRFFVLEMLKSAFAHFFCQLLFIFLPFSCPFLSGYFYCVHKATTNL